MDTGTLEKKEEEIRTHPSLNYHNQIGRELPEDINGTTFTFPSEHIFCDSKKHKCLGKNSNKNLKEFCHCYIAKIIF